MPKTTATAPTAAQLNACKDRDAARALLPSALLRPQLLALAAELSVPGASRLNKAALVEAIVATTAGHRLGADAILNSITAPPARPAAAVAEPLPASITSRSHARLADDIRRTTLALIAGEAVDSAVIAELAAAAADLAEVAAKLAAPADDDRAVALDAIRSGAGQLGWTAITHLRAALGHLDRGQQDTLMVGLLRVGLVHPIPAANLKALTADDRAAALEVGGQLTHMIQLTR